MALREYVDKAKVEAVAEFQTSQNYFDKMGTMYGDGFEDFRKQAILLYLGIDFSQVQMKLNKWICAKKKSNGF